MNWQDQVNALRNAIVGGDSEAQQLQFYAIDSAVGECEKFPQELFDALMAMFAQLKIKKCDDVSGYFRVFENNLDLMADSQRAVLSESIESTFGDLSDPASMVLALEILVHSQSPAQVVQQLRRMATSTTKPPLSVLPYGVRYLLEQDEATEPIYEQCVKLLQRLTEHHDKQVSSQANVELQRVLRGS